MSEVKGYDMSRYWRLIGVEGGNVTGTWWVSRRKGHDTTVRPANVTVWHEDRQWGRYCTDVDGLHATVKDDGTVDLPERMIRGKWRDDVLEEIDAVKASILAAARADWLEVPDE